jgi:hypothetical protein
LQEFLPNYEYTSQNLILIIHQPLIFVKESIWQ